MHGHVAGRRAHLCVQSCCACPGCRVMETLAVLFGLDWTPLVLLLPAPRCQGVGTLSNQELRGAPAAHTHRARTGCSLLLFAPALQLLCLGRRRLTKTKRQHAIRWAAASACWLTCACQTLETELE